MPRLEDLERLLAAEPNDPFILYGLAQEHARLGHHTLALAFFDRCIAADPAYLYAYYHKARTLTALGDRAGAAAVARGGAEAAKRAGDMHALDELTSLVEELSP